MIQPLAVPLFSTHIPSSHLNPGAHFASASISLHPPHIAAAKYRTKCHSLHFINFASNTHIILFCMSDNIRHSRSSPNIHQLHSRLAWQMIDNHSVSYTQQMVWKDCRNRGLCRTASNSNSSTNKSKPHLTQIFASFFFLVQQKRFMAYKLSTVLFESFTTNPCSSTELVKKLTVNCLVNR